MVFQWTHLKFASANSMTSFVGEFYGFTVDVAYKNSHFFHKKNQKDMKLDVNCEKKHRNTKTQTG